MRALIWSVFGVLTALWTAVAWLTAAAVGWLAGTAGSAQGVELGALVSQIPVPPWLSYWIDPATLRLAFESLAWTLNAIGDLAPWIAGAVGWLVPVVWVVWAFGALLMLALAGGLHLLVGRSGSPPQAPGAVRAQGA